MASISQILLGGTIDDEMVEKAKHSTFITTDEPLRQYSSYFICTVLSAIIATGAIAAESTAIVIGAMLIAPLMSPMLGTSFAIAVGKPKKALKTITIAAAGAAIVIVVAALVTFVIPAGIPIDGNVEISSRTSPRVVDLIVAVASGLVGAMAITRKDISDTIPGVAIAVSIVPPLCVVGIGMVNGNPSMALGALLLFVVNFFAIQLTGNIAFYLMGFGKRKTDEASIKARRFWNATAIIGTLLLTVPLVATSNSIIQTADTTQKAKTAVAEWLDGSGYASLSIKSEDETTLVEIAGNGDYPDIDTLLELMREEGIDDPKASVLVMHGYSS